MEASRICTWELKSQIVSKVGRPKGDIYFDLVRKYLGDKIRKCEFDKLCVATIGRENVRLHNQLMLSIVKNAHFSKVPPSPQDNVGSSPSWEEAKGCQKSDGKSLCDYIPSYPHKGRTPNLRQWKFRVRPSPLGPHRKSGMITCQDPVQTLGEQTAPKIHSLGRRPTVAKEDGKKVKLGAGSLSVLTRSLITAPLGFRTYSKGMRKESSSNPSNACRSETCYSSGELPDNSILMKSLEQKVEMEGLSVSVDCANLLNNSLDVFLKRLIKPCVELANSSSRQVFHESKNQQVISRLNQSWPVECIKLPSQSNSASILDFQVATYMNPQILGQDWPAQLEKINICASDSRD